MAEFEKVYNNISKLVSGLDAMSSALNSAFTPDVIERLQKMEETANNVGSTFRPTPEMQQAIEEFRKFGEAVETIKGFADKVDSFVKENARHRRPQRVQALRYLRFPD